jgi:hypothetical protein
MRQKLRNLVGLLSSDGKGLKLDKDPVIAGHVRDAGVRWPGIPRIQRRLPPERDVRYYRIRTVQPTVQYCTGNTFRPFFIDSRLLFVECAGFYFILNSVDSLFKIVELFPYSYIRGIPPAIISDIALLPALVNNNWRTHKKNVKGNHAKSQCREN